VISLSTTGGNITTKDINSGSSFTGNAGNIILSITGGNGAINTTLGSLQSYSSSGNAGAISLSTTGGGNISTKNMDSRSIVTGTGGNINLSVTGGTGFINTSAGLTSSYSSSGNAGAS
jgi:hypothetical protein